MATSNTDTTRTGVTAERLQTGKTFERNREAVIEFRSAATSAKLFRKKLATKLSGASDPGLFARLAGAMREIQMLDAINGRGKRNVMDGEINKLVGFEFNPRSPFVSKMKVEPVPGINRVTGELTLNFPAFIPKEVVDAPKEATHFKLINAGLEVDFKKNESEAGIKESDLIPLDNIEIPAFQMLTKVTPDSKSVLFVLGGIRFYQKILNGDVYQLNNTSYNAICVFGVSKL